MEIDFNMADGVVEVPVRAAMLLHFLRPMRLDGVGRQIEVANAPEVKRELNNVADKY